MIEILLSKRKACIEWFYLGYVLESTTESEDTFFALKVLSKIWCNSFRPSAKYGYVQFKFHRYCKVSHEGFTILFTILFDIIIEENPG